MDVIASAAFGLDVNSQRDPNNQFVKNAKLLFNSPIAAAFRIILSKYLPSIKQTLH